MNLRTLLYGNAWGMLCALLLLPCATLQAQRQEPAAMPCWPTQNNMLRLQPNDTLQAGQLYLGLDATLFLRNTEYFAPLAAGYTNINYRLSPTLTYAINNRTTFTGGVQYDGVFGEDSVNRFYPMVRLEYQANPWLRVILGSIYGGLSHGLDGPMYSYEYNFFTHYYRPEAGVQLLTRTKHWCADIWMNWENYLNAYTYDEEQFVIGTRQEITWVDNRGDKATWLTLQMPYSAMVAHHGGQFSLVDTNNGSLLNAHAALSATLHWSNGDNHLRLYLPFYYFRDISGEDRRHNAPAPWHLPFQEGWGVYPQLTWQQSLGKHTSCHTSDVLLLTAGLWHGNRYLSSRGDHLFQSMAFNDKTLTFPKRNMLALSAAFEHRYHNLTLGIDLQLYHDMGLRDTYYAYGLYMRWNLMHPLLRNRP